jgi:hypothetical protein
MIKKVAALLRPLLDAPRKLLGMWGQLPGHVRSRIAYATGFLAFVIYQGFQIVGGLRTNRETYRSHFALALGVMAVICLIPRVSWRSHERITQLIRPFPSLNLFLLLTAVGCIFYPINGALQNFGIAPLVVFVALLVALIPPLSRRHSHVTGATSLAALAVGAWLWELAGHGGLVVLPAADIADNQQVPFTSDALGSALLDEITHWPSDDASLLTPSDPSVRHGKAEVIQQLVTASAPLMKSGAHRVLGRTPEALELTGAAEVGGVHLAPIYRTLRRFRHRPTLEAEITFGSSSVWTLALRRSNFPAECFSDHLADRLITDDYSGKADAALGEMMAKIERDNALATIDRQEKPGCSTTVGERLLSFLGISEPATTQYELIGEARVFNPTGKDRLSKLIHQVLIASMGEIAPDRMAVYFDRLSRPESALTYYRRAMPLAVVDERRTGGDLSSRLRVAELLIRIAALEEMRASPPDMDEDKARHARHVRALDILRIATSLVPDHAPTVANFGHFIVQKVRVLLGDSVLTNDEARAELEAAADALRIASAVDKGRLAGDYGVLEARQFVSTSFWELATSEVFTALLSEPPIRETLLQGAVEHVERASQELVLQAGSMKGGGPLKTPQDEEADVLRVYQLRNDAMKHFVAILMQKDCRQHFNKLQDIAYNSALDDAQTTAVIALLRDAAQRCRDTHVQGLTEAMYELGTAAQVYGEHRFMEAVGAFDATALTFAEAKSELRSPKAGVKLASTLEYYSALARRTAACSRDEHIDDQTRRTLLTQAIDRLNRSIESDSQNWDAKLARAKILASDQDASPRLDMALRDATEVAALKPSDATAQLTLAGVLFRMGKLEDAQHKAELAVALSPDDTRTHYLLGTILMERGDVDYGKNEWRYARALDPNEWYSVSNPLPGCAPLHKQRLASGA